MSNRQAVGKMDAGTVRHFDVVRNRWIVDDRMIRVACQIQFGGALCDRGAPFRRGSFLNDRPTNATGTNQNQRNQGDNYQCKTIPSRFGRLYLPQISQGVPVSVVLPNLKFPQFQQGRFAFDRRICNSNPHGFRLRFQLNENL